MSAGDDKFEVRLGRIRSASGASRVTGFFRQVRCKAGGRGGRSRQRSTRLVSATQFHRRVIVKSSISRHRGTTVGQRIGGMRAHLNYLERDGERASVFDRNGEKADGKALIGNAKDDRHHFRFILSPEDSGQMADLSSFTQDLVSQMEEDLGTRLEWVAVNHYDTGHPHTHLLVRGIRDDGTDLVMPRDYMTQGIRRRAQDLVSLELGPVSEMDGRNRLAASLHAERLTDIDRGLFKQAQGGEIDFAAPAKRGRVWRRQLERKRLLKLQKLGLAESLGKGRWRLRPDMCDTLRRLGERGDIIRTLQRSMTQAGRGQIMTEASIYDPVSNTARKVTGEILKTGIADDVADRAFLVLETQDSNLLYVNVGSADTLKLYRNGMIVTVEPGRQGPRPSDKTVYSISNQNEGRYSPTGHMESDPKARPEYVQSHVRRLEALRRAGYVERSADGTWSIPEDYLERAGQYEKHLAQSQPPRITRQSHLTLSQMQTAHGLTWLDAELMSEGPSNPPKDGFGARLGQARQVRRAWLADQGFISKADSFVTKQVLETLGRHDLNAAGEALSEEIGKAYRAPPQSGRVSGFYRKAIDRPSGRFAVIERAKDFTLVPWRPVMDRNLGKSIGGVVRGQQISWTLTKGQGIS